MAQSTDIRIILPSVSVSGNGGTNAMNMYKKIDSYDVEEGHELIVRDKETGKERHGIVQHVSDHRFVLKCRKDTVWCNKADCTTTLTFIKLDNKLSKAKLL